MDAAAGSTAVGPGLGRLIEDYEVLGRLTDYEAETARCRLEDVLGQELAGRLLGALTRREPAQRAGFSVGD